MPKYPITFAAAVAGSLVLIAPSFTLAGPFFSPSERAAAPQALSAAPSAAACYVLSPSGLAPTPGVYRARVWPTVASPGCSFQANATVPEYTYYYGGPGSKGSYYLPSPWAAGEIYTETDYIAPSSICTDPQAGTAAAKVTGQATVKLLPGGFTGQLTYSEKWTYVDPNSFIVTGHYSAASCVADETIVYIRTGQ
jgi:hypothetical protein